MTRCNAFLIALLVVILIACKKNGAQPADTATQQTTTTTSTNTNQATFVASKNIIVTPLTGQWRLFKFIGYGADFTGTRKAVFGSDSTMSYFRNDTLLIRLNYSYQDNFKFPDNSTGAKVVISGQNQKCTITNDTLKLATYDVFDGGINYYVRIK